MTLLRSAKGRHAAFSAGPKTLCICRNHWLSVCWGAFRMALITRSSVEALLKPTIYVQRTTAHREGCTKAYSPEPWFRGKPTLRLPGTFGH